MKKVGIITLNGYFNFGNRLQNYALQEMIIKEGFDVETILVPEKKASKESPNPRKKSLLTIRNINFRKLVNGVYNVMLNQIKKDEINKTKHIREERFKEFTLNKIKEVQFEGKHFSGNLVSNYDYFITGSDQVWNPNYNLGSSVYFLQFAPKSKRIAYAPSFGVSGIKPEIVEDYKEWISGINKLSVREEEGAKIIKELTGRNAPVLVDPTLLLTKEKWLSIAKEASNKPKDKYILTYFLGGIPTQYKKEIKKIAKENNLEIINLGYIKEKDTYQTGPSEFIDYINNCSVMFTDSFHGTVFSILFERPFVVFQRMGGTSMYSRIDTLLNKFKLNFRKVENMSLDDDLFEVDFSHVPQILEAERKKSLEYLKDALEIKDAN